MAGRWQFVVISCSLFALLVGSISLWPSNSSAQSSGPEATIEALETRVVELKSTSTARGKKINAQRTVIANLESQIPPTVTPTPELSGKEAYTWLDDPRDILARPFNHIDEKWVFCGTVLTLQVASPGNAYFVGDNDPKAYENLLQVFPSGYSEAFMVGFDGDTSGIFEDSFVCVWGTVVDTASGTNAFGGTIVNPLFDAEFLELG